MAQTVAVLTPRVKDLETALESLESLRSQNCAWTWYLGCEEGLDTTLLADPHVVIVRIEQSDSRSETLNRMVVFIEEDFLCLLEPGDRLPPHSLEIRRDGMRSHMGWTGGVATYELDGQSLELKGSLRPGPIESGELGWAWAHSYGAFPLEVRTLLYRTEIVRRAGGWQDLGDCDDLTLALDVSSMSPGYRFEESLYTRRSFDTPETFEDFERITWSLVAEREALKNWNGSGA